MELPPVSEWKQNTEVNKEKTQMTEAENAELCKRKILEDISE